MRRSLDPDLLAAACVLCLAAAMASTFHAGPRPGRTHRSGTERDRSRQPTTTTFTYDDAVGFTVTSVGTADGSVPSYSYDPPPPPERDRGVTYRYDAEGNLIADRARDAAGTVDFAYDEGRLTAMTYGDNLSYGYQETVRPTERAAETSRYDLSRWPPGPRVKPTLTTRTIDGIEAGPSLLGFRQARAV